MLDLVFYVLHGATVNPIMQDLPESIKQKIQGAQPALGVFL